MGILHAGSTPSAVAFAIASGQTGANHTTPTQSDAVFAGAASGVMCCL